jgi:hypothetical protein
MGKKNKYTKNDLHYGHNKDTNDTLKRYGLDRSNYAQQGAISQGRVHGKGNYDDMEQELLRRAGSDYHTNRAIEASAMAGNKDAQEFAKNGIGNVTDLMKIQEMQKKQHKKMGNGGSFSSASDFAGLSYGLAQKDRDNQTQGYRDEFASKSALADLESKLSSKKQEEDAKFTPEKSEQRLKDEATVEYFDENFATGGIYGDESERGPAMSDVYKEYGAPLLEPMMNKRKADEKNQANKFLDAYKQDLFQGGAALMPEI